MPLADKPSNWVGLGWLAGLIICIVPILWVIGVLVLKLMGVGEE